MERKDRSNAGVGNAAAAAPMREVAGKVAFVTGGDSGVGLGIVRALLGAGMKVGISYRSQAHLEGAMRAIGEDHQRVHAINVDVTDRTAMQAAAAEMVDVFGKVHVLINNAGVAPGVPLSVATFDDWDWCMGVNVNGVFNGVRSFLPVLREHGEGGHIVATSSVAGGLIVGPFWGLYSASKFAVVGMMEALRSELAGTDIGVSVFCPGSVSSNIAHSERNRPPGLADSAAAHPEALAFVEQFNSSLGQLLQSCGNSSPMMDPDEAGRCVLRGIRSNDLYILSHPEYEQAIRERNDALLASIQSGGPIPSEGRVALARIARSQIYVSEIERKRASGTL